MHNIFLSLIVWLCDHGVGKVVILVFLLKLWGLKGALFELDAGQTGGHFSTTTGIFNKVSPLNYYKGGGWHLILIVVIMVCLKGLKT